MSNITQIPAPRVPLIDGSTGLMTTQWFRYFNNINNIIGGGTGVITPEFGGTGTNTAPVNGQILIGNNTGAYTVAYLTAGAGLFQTPASGALTVGISNTGVTAASYGSASTVPSFTVNAQGQLTAAANTPIVISYTQVTGLGTMATQNANTVAITGGAISGTDLNTQANTNSVLAWIGTTAQPTVNIYPVQTMTTLAILDGYYFNDLENATPLYQGKSDINANWLVIEYDQTAGTINYANVGNNPTYTDYNSAWAARATLVYDEFQDMVFP